MNTLTMHRLEIKNFKGIKSLTIEPTGNSIKISGANGTGKTTIQDSFTWLLFGKDSSDKSDFQLKPVDGSGNELHNLDTEVTATMELSGELVTLKKRFSEKWIKKRGNRRAEFTGHTTDYFIDAIPIKKKEFDIRVSDIADPSVFKLVTSPAEFNRLHWKDRRKILLDMCGDVSDQDVIHGNEELAGLSEVIGRRSIEDHMKVVKAQQRDINKELEMIPVRVDELSASLADIQTPDLKTKLSLEKDLAAEKDKLNSVRNNEMLSEKRIQANEIRAQIQDVQHQAKTSVNDEVQKIQDNINMLVQKKKKLKAVIEMAEMDIERDENRNNTVTDAIARLRDQWHAVNEKVTETDDTCPACGQNLPADKIEAARTKANQIKAGKLAEIQKEGKALKKAIDARTIDIEVSRNRIKKAESEINGIDVHISDLHDHIPEEPKADISDLEKNLAIVRSEIDALENGRGIQEKTIQSNIDDISRKLADIAAEEAEVKAAERTRVRITELEAQEKKLAKEYEQLAHQVYMAERFIIEKVKLLEDRINSQFKMATFKLFREQINGGIEECCETLHKGVPYNSGLNNAARINTGIDICNTIAGFYGFRGPVFVDNSEAVNQLIEIPAQIIAMAVTDDPEIVVETIYEEEAA